jgi:hypothetical protein
MVMARHLGRMLGREENVHHLNGDKTDNRLVNLTLIDWTTHGREHSKIERRMTALMAENLRLRQENEQLRNALAEKQTQDGRQI